MEIPIVKRIHSIEERFERQFHDCILSSDFDYVYRDGVYHIHRKVDHAFVISVSLDHSGGTIVIRSSDFINGFRELVRCVRSDYDEYMETLFQNYRALGFPWPMYLPMDLVHSFQQLIRLNPEHPNLTLSTRNREGDRLIQHFHHSIWRAHTKNDISPYDAWQDDKLLRKVIENRTLYRSTLNPNKILQGFNISKIAPKVSVFSAGRAKLLIHRYLDHYDTIFDPFSGFSGRMLGTLSMGKTYIGQDLSGWHVQESNELLEFLRKAAHHFPKEIASCLHTTSVQRMDIMHSHGEYPCLFTCPPYADKEQWYGVSPSTQTCDDWIDCCLERFQCKRYLFVVDHTERYSSYVVDTIINKSHFGSNKEYVIVIDR